MKFVCYNCKKLKDLKEGIIKHNAYEVGSQLNLCICCKSCYQKELK